MTEIMLPTDFTLDDLLNVLDVQGQQEHIGFHTLKEWKELLGVSSYRMTKLLHLAASKGILLRDRQHRANVLNGVVRPVQVYGFKSEDKT